MKKSNYLWLALVAFIFYCCSSDSIIPEEEESVSVSTEAKTNENTTLELETNATNLPVTGNNKIPTEHNSNTSKARELTPDGTPIGGNGNCIDNSQIPPPGISRVLVTFIDGLSESEKTSVRCHYANTGVLLGYFPCRDQNKEIWTLAPGVNPCSFDTNLGRFRTDGTINPPADPPVGLLLIECNVTSCL